MDHHTHRGIISAFCYRPSQSTVLSDLQQRPLRRLRPWNIIKNVIKHCISATQQPRRIVQSQEHCGTLLAKILGPIQGGTPMQGTQKKSAAASHHAQPVGWVPVVPSRLPHETQTTHCARECTTIVLIGPLTQALHPLAESGPILQVKRALFETERNNVLTGKRIEIMFVVLQCSLKRQPSHPALLTNANPQAPLTKENKTESPTNHFTGHYKQ